MSKKTKSHRKPENYPKLREVWYKKLAQSGFQDAEEDDFHLKQYSNRFAQPTAIRNWHAKSEYYSMAGQFLHTHKFASNLEKTIWEYHVNGIGVRDIAKLLKKVRVIKPNKDNVQAIIAKLVVEMKLKYLVGDKK